MVTAVGFKDELAIVTHSADCLPTSDQVSLCVSVTLL